MKIKEEFLKAAHERKTHFEEWLDRIKRAQACVPKVKDVVERTDWEINAFSDLPEGGRKIIPPEFVIDYTRKNEYLRKMFPLPQAYNYIYYDSMASISTSGSTAAYSIVSKASEINNKLIQAWSSEYTFQYRQMQEKQSRFDKVKTKLHTFNSDREDELDLAQRAYSAAVTDVGERCTAGITMRNLLEHFKGDLFEKAKQRPIENMTWEKMAKRLAINGTGSIEHSELIKQKVEWSSLHCRLSEVAKGQKHGLVADIEDIWTKLIDHLFTILGIINLEA